MKKKLEDLEKQAAEIDHEVEDEEEPETKTEIDAAKIVGQPRRRTAKIDDDEDEFELNEAESQTSEESADEQIEEELAKELEEKKQRQKRQIQSDQSENEKEEEEVKPAKTATKPTNKVTPQRQASAPKRTPQNGTKASPVKRQSTQESSRISTPEDPTPPQKTTGRGGRRKSNVQPATKSPAKPPPRNARQTKATSKSNLPSTSQSSSASRANQQFQQVRPPMHQQVGHHQPMTSNIAYISPQQSVAYALPPHIRQVPATVHYVQTPHVVHQPSYEYYGEWIAKEKVNSI